MTKTEIANLALSHLGAKLLNDIATDTTQQAICVRLWFDAARDDMLSSHPWNFAIARAILTPLYFPIDEMGTDGGLVEVTKIDHGLPTGSRIFLKGVTGANGHWYITSTSEDTFTLEGSQATGTYSGGGSYTRTPAFGWDFQHPLPADCLRVLKVGGEEGQADDDGEDYEIEGGMLLAQSDQIQVRYIYRHTAYSSWPQYFTNTFSYLLASHCAQNLTGPAGQAMTLRQAYEETLLPKARVRDARESKPRRTLPIRDSQLLAARGGALP